MDKSFVYSNIPANNDLASLGWFQPKIPFGVIGNANYVKFINEQNTNISKNTLVAYFPGCFAEFHIGHLDVVKQAIEHCRAITNDYLVVIAPANSDYTTEKYGKNSLFATNKYRYNRICSMLSGIEGNVVVDLNPMLNYEADFNFTDLIFDFIARQGVEYNDLVHVPRIICGKDRDYFSNLVKLTDKLDVFYVNDTTGASSSSHIKAVNNTSVKKKKLLLRCDNHEQYDLFVKYFADQYEEIELQLLSDEIIKAKQLNDIHNFDVTICKDYSDFLPYVKVHRSFENPLDSGNGHITQGTFENLKVLDSDVFSGGTKNFIVNQGGFLYAVHDFSEQLNDRELLDITDFYDEKFCYPYVDISSRCSMSAFNLDSHKNFLAFKTELKNIRR
jgi:glycerol-3-phosphate cytidylyltransferase-like family protein